MFFIQVLQVDFLADFQFTLVYTGLLFLPPDEIVTRYDSDILVCAKKILAVLSCHVISKFVAV